MMYKVLAAVAIAASQLSSAAACGWLDEKCCNIPEGRPNDGECLDDRTVCWEERCMMCGVNGKKGCDTKPYCEEGFLLNEAGWCYTDPDSPVEFECAGGCAHGKACNPHNGICEACGGNGELVCDEGDACEDGNEAKNDGYCHEVYTATPPDFSCNGGCPNGKACNPHNGNCEACGKNGLLACDGGECETGSTENGEGYCSVDPHCGWFNEQCCAGDKCFEGVCEGTCVEEEVDDSPCGDVDWPCCNEAQRSYLGTDDSCSKTANGVCCNGTCKEDTCDDGKDGKDGKEGKEGKEGRKRMSFM